MVPSALRGILGCVGIEAARVRRRLAGTSTRESIKMIVRQCSTIPWTDHNWWGGCWQRDGGRKGCFHYRMAHKSLEILSQRIPPFECWAFVVRVCFGLWRWHEGFSWLPSQLHPCSHSTLYKDSNCSIPWCHRVDGRESRQGCWSCRLGHMALRTTSNIRRQRVGVEPFETPHKIKV
jgi:hypothetical protein